MACGLPSRLLLDRYKVLARATARTRPVPARRAQGQNCACEEPPGSLAGPPSTTCGQLGACTHGRFHIDIEGFHGGQDCPLLVSGSVLPARYGPRAGSRFPVGSSRCKIPLRNSRGALEFDFLSNPSVSAAFRATSGARDAKALASRVC